MCCARRRYSGTLNGAVRMKILDGYRLLESERDELSRARLLVRVARLLLQADKAQDITRGEFFGPAMPAQRKLLEQVLAQRANDRDLNFLAARFQFTTGELSRAERAISKAVSEEDLARTFRGYYLDQLRS